MTRAELLRAVVAERWPDPAAVEQERPEPTAERRSALIAATAGYGRRGRLPANPTNRRTRETAA